MFFTSKLNLYSVSERMFLSIIHVIEYLDRKPGDAVKRNVMRVFNKVTIPEDEDAEGKLFDHAISYLRSNGDPVAVKVFSMTVARKICERYPELAQEAILPIEILVKEELSTGTVNRGKKELKKLYSLQKRE